MILKSSSSGIDGDLEVILVLVKSEKVKSEKVKSKKWVLEGKKLIRPTIPLKRKVI